MHMSSTCVCGLLYSHMHRCVRVCVAPVNTTTIHLYTEPLSPIPSSQFSGTLALFGIRLPSTGEFSSTVPG